MTLRLAACLLALAVGAAQSGPLTELERQRLVAHLEMTGSWLVDEVSGLSDAQLRFWPAPEAWNILEVVEHLAVASPIYWQDLRKAMQAPPGRARRSAADADVLWYGIDRTQRQQAIASERPKGQLRDLKAALAALSKLHAQMIEYARTTQEDLRNHVVEREASDAYQWLLLISAHQQRHILQIREIKANPKFPRSKP